MVGGMLILYSLLSDSVSKPSSIRVGVVCLKPQIRGEVESSSPSLPSEQSGT
jgi:hypothetical protein